MIEQQSQNQETRQRAGSEALNVIGHHANRVQEKTQAPSVRIRLSETLEGVMAIRKAVEDRFTVNGAVGDWLSRIEAAFKHQAFKNIQSNASTGQVSGDFKPWVGTLSGDVQVTLVQQGPQTAVHVVATGDADNVFAIVASPGKRLIDKLKDGLQATGAFEAAGELVAQSTSSSDSVSSELGKLAELHAKGLIDDAEFKAAKAKLLS